MGNRYAIKYYLRRLCPLKLNDTSRKPSLSISLVMIDAIAGVKMIPNGDIPLILSQYAGIDRTIEITKNKTSPRCACFFEYSSDFSVSVLTL